MLDYCGTNVNWVPVIYLDQTESSKLCFLVLVWLTDLLPVWLSAGHPGAWQLFLHPGDGIYYIASEMKWMVWQQ